jgi:predicted metal-dependent hydrolase
MPPMNKRERISHFVRSLDSAPSEGSSQNYYAAYFQLWNVQKYYEAHDVLEQLWLGEKDAELARFYQGLIQAAGAFVHLQKNFQHPSHSKHSRRLPPATRLFDLALRNLGGLPNEFRGLDLMRFRELLRRYRDEIVAGDFRGNPWSPESAPQLNLLR